VPAVRIDWGEGDYGRTAQVLVPAAGALVEAAGVAAGARVLDVACGTGSAALAAAALGASAVGVDASERLVALARWRAEREGASAEFLVGDAERLPVPDASFDVTVSAFGVIFAADAARAVGEMLRATRPGGVIALSSWLPEGAIGAAGRALRDALPAEEGAAPRWDDPGWVRALLQAEGAREARAEPAGTVTFTAASPGAWLAEQEAHHPVWRFARRALDDAGWERVRATSLAALEAGNEDPAAFRATSRYMIARAVR
jgi:ubiquinone/menaquinone biosynthesis C-methylase UbiE